MSYLGNRRRRARRGMSGLQSRPYGPGIALTALAPVGDMPEYGAAAAATVVRPKRALGATVVEYTPAAGLFTPPVSQLPPPKLKSTKLVRAKAVSYPMTVHGPALQGPPDWYRAMNGVSLGDAAADTTPTASVLTDGTQQWQGSMLSLTQQIADSQAAFAEKDRWIRYVQIAATLSIPLAAAVWKAIFSRGASG